MSYRQRVVKVSKCPSNCKSPTWDWSCLVIFYYQAQSTCIAGTVHVSYLLCCDSQDTSIIHCGTDLMYYLVPINVSSLSIAVGSCHFCNSFKSLPNSALDKVCITSLLRSWCFNGIFYEGLRNKCGLTFHDCHPPEWKQGNANMAYFIATACARSATDMCNPTMSESCFDSTKYFQRVLCPTLTISLKWNLELLVWKFL